MPEPVQPSLEHLRAGVQLACQPTHMGPIERGRLQVLQMPRAWVRMHIHTVATDALDLNDYWEYRRLLELLAMLDPDLIAPLVEQGLHSADPDVREAAEDFRNPENVGSVGQNFLQDLINRYPDLQKQSDDIQPNQ
jgi:hypothetical protein